MPIFPYSGSQCGKDFRGNEQMCTVWFVESGKEKTDTFELMIPFNALFKEGELRLKNVAERRIEDIFRNSELIVGR